MPKLIKTLVSITAAVVIPAACNPSVILGNGGILKLFIYQLVIQFEQND
jgi:hypothetical protein